MGFEKLSSVVLASTLALCVGDRATSEVSVGGEVFGARDSIFSRANAVVPDASAGNSGFQFDHRARLLQEHLDTEERLGLGVETAEEKELNSEIEKFFSRKLRSLGLSGKPMFLFKNDASTEMSGARGAIKFVAKVRGMNFVISDLETIGIGDRAIVTAVFLAKKNGKIVSGFTISAAIVRPVSPSLNSNGEVSMFLKMAHFSDHVHVELSGIREVHDCPDEL